MTVMVRRNLWRGAEVFDHEARKWWHRRWRCGDRQRGHRRAMTVGCGS
jgi:hypothetical protein